MQVAAAGGRRTAAGADTPAGGARLPPGVLVALFGIGLFALALAPRWIARDTYVTADEDNWMRRAGGFAWGMANGRPGRTFQNGHPGVLTMELAILGQGPGGAERFADPVTGNPRVVTAVPGFFEGLVEARRAFALATAAFVGVFGVLVWRLLGVGPAVMAGGLLALDPFYLAHSQLVHLDAALTGCMTLALLCSLVRWSGGGRGWLVAGGALSGLAVLAKVPGVYLGVAIPLVALVVGGRRGVRGLVGDLGVWAVTAAVAFVAFWPSMWVNPASSIERMIGFARVTGGEPHEQGSFFLGQAVVDPGPLFYLVAMPLRLSPLAVAGLAALALVGWSARGHLEAGQRRMILALLVYAVGFGLFMTVGAKKFDRYLLPVFPVLDLLAGVGLWSAWSFAVDRVGRVHHSRGGLAPEGHGGQSPPYVARVLALGGTALVAVLPVALVFPHYLAYYNPLLGGGPVAARLIPVGEGEGLREAAEWLNRQPNAASLSVVSHSYDALKANFVGSGEALRDRVPPSADFVVLYHYQAQIGHAAGVLAEYGGRAAEHAVWIQGIEYARIYRGPKGG